MITEEKNKILIGIYIYNLGAGGRVSVSGCSLVTRQWGDEDACSGKVRWQTIIEAEIG